MGIPILQGRGISEEDLFRRRKVAVVNHAFARRYFGTKNPLGRQVKLAEFDSPEDPKQVPWFEIVGVSADTVRTSRTSFDHVGHSEPNVYVCYTVHAGPFVQVLVRTGGMSASLEQSLGRAGAALDKEAPMDIWSLEEMRQQAWFRVPRFLTAIFLTFACLGLILVSVGVFGVLSYAVSQRTHEIGVGMALGGQHTDVRGMVVVSGLGWVGMGVGRGGRVRFAVVK